MNILNGKVIEENRKVLGLKNSDIEKLANSQESSFTMPSADTMQTVVPGAPQPFTNVVPNPQVQPEYTSPSPNGFVNIEQPQAPIQNNKIEEAVVQPVPVTPTPQPSNIFDAMPSEPVMPNTAAPNYEVNNNIYDTPASFFNKVEQPEPVNAVAMEEDPALILIGNLKDVVEGKNQLIKALNDKIEAQNSKIIVLEEQLRVSEERAKAAEITLTNARREEAQGGPSLVYTNPNMGINPAPSQPINFNNNQMAA